MSTLNEMAKLAAERISAVQNAYNPGTEWNGRMATLIAAEVEQWLCERLNAAPQGQVDISGQDDLMPWISVYRIAKALDIESGDIEGCEFRPKERA